MAYSAEINRKQPTCFLFVIDQSGSMVDNLADGKSKAWHVANKINGLLQNLVSRCSKSDGIRDYFYIGVIGYGQDSKVVSAFEGNLSGKELIPISEIADNPLEFREIEQMIDDGNFKQKQTSKFPVWINPIADGSTPMCEAFTLVNQVIDNWLKQNSNCFPPIVIHITDGESTDGDPSSKMAQLRNMSSSDGNVLLFNVHLSSANSTNPLFFPSNDNNLPDSYANLLYNNSSLLTPYMIETAQKEHGINCDTNARGFVYNGDLDTLIKALDIGSRVDIK